jgi:bile acid:Na+ symporter, BASS family
VHDILRTVVIIASSQLVTLLALDVGLLLRVEDLRRQIKNLVLWRTLLIALVAVPMLAVLVALVLPLGPITRGALVLMSVSPGAPLMINKARGQCGNLALAATITVALTLAALVTMPVELRVLNRLFPLHLQASVPALLRILVPSLLIPLAVGVAARLVSSKGADVLERVVRVVFLLALVLVAIAALATAWHQIGRIGPFGWLAMILVTLGATVLGDLVGGRDPRNRKTAAYAVVLGNPAVAIQVATDIYPSLKALPVIVAYVVLRAIIVLPYALVSRVGRQVQRAPDRKPRRAVRRRRAAPGQRRAHAPCALPRHPGHRGLARLRSGPT